ncbi:hypothetical protein [Clostridium sp.]|uniref:hypothetical protein n=1 Tax=Clostridium sp. TaxID=1506 RepID=UPI00261B7F30|nr:hypothetical protein [Clostridium sp.]
MTNKEKVIKWLEDNQDKEVYIDLMMYELAIVKNFKDGYTLQNEFNANDTFVLRDKKDKNDEIRLMFFNCDDEGIIINVGKDNTQMEADCDISINDHFTISFYFL